MNSRVKEIIGQYKEKLAESQVDPLNVSPGIRAGTEALVRNAVRDLPEIVRQYKDEVMKHAILIAAHGENSQEFANIAKYKFKTIAVNYYHVLDKMVASMRKRGVRDSFHNQEYSMALDEFGQVRMEYDIVQLPPPRINHNVDRVYNETLETAMKNLIEVNYNNQLYSVVVRREIGRQALEVEFAGKFLPVVLYNYNGNLDEALLPRPLMVVDCTKKVDEKFVGDKLAEVRAKLNPKQGKKKTESNLAETVEDATGIQGE